MRYGKIPYVDRPFSRFVLGTSVKGMQNGRNSDGVLDGALELGITAIDTARGYGRSEYVLGEWMERRGVRGQIVLISKGGLDGVLGNRRVSEKNIRGDLEKSLNALRTDSIDLYFLHRDNSRYEAGEIAEWMDALVREGKIKAWGVSNWTFRRIREAIEYAGAHGLQPPSASQIHYGLAATELGGWRGCLSLTGEKNAEARAWYESTQFPVTAYSPLGRGMLSGKFKSGDYAGARRAMDGAARRGFLSAENMERLRRTEELSEKTGRSVPQLALAWALASAMNVSVIIGSGRRQSLERNLPALDVELTPGECAYLNLEKDTAE